MSKHKNLKRNLLICLLAGSAVMYTLPLHAATSVVANNALPTLPMVNGQIKDGYGFVTGGSNTNIVTDGLQMNITQNDLNAVIKWGSFDVGGSATVNFKGPESGYNTLNYVNAGGSMSQIYGTINANNNGHIFIVNPAGVQIGNSAQINVGSLYVSNKYLNESKLGDFAGKITPEMINTGKNADAVLMSLGNINAGEVTFEGNGRIVIDSERIKDAAGDEKLNYQNINIKTSETNKNNIIIGYEAYDETITNGSVVGYDNKNTDEVIATVTTENGTSQYKKANGYMWVEDVEQLQAIGKNANTLSGNYALRNSIDATSTANWNEVNGTYEGFNPIGLDKTGKVIVNNNEYGFTGNFDGLDYNIFGLTINRESEANVGLFGVAHNANINNVTLVGGSITGGSVVGSVIGAALGNTHITNATNSASVTGNTDVGGIVGYSGDDIDNTQNGNISDITTDAHFSNLINTGAVHSNGEQNKNVSNAGGLIGYMFNGTLDGNSYNLGDVSGDGYNVGGLVGHAVNSTIGDGTNLVYNRMDVTGAYNVGGIVGNMEGTTVQNAENSGNVTATGFMTGKYYYHTANGGTHIAKVDVNVANVGGIAGKADDTVKADGTVDKKSEIKNVTNSGNVSSSKQAGNDYYYDAGNVGGIVGSAVDTNITNATNRENEVRGAHNVGGVAGYFGSTKGDSTDKDTLHYTVTNGINDGGDIMATGARYGNDFVKETVRPVGDANESFIIGNIGGVVGYLEGDNVYVTGSANRGTVHTDEPADPADVNEWQKAANVGGVVGKIDRNKQNTLNEIKNGNETANEIKNGNETAAVTNSYNTGDVLGYTGVGGVIGMMYNGAVSGSYNLGTVNTTRQVDRSGGSNIDPLNMGGIVGDTTEETNASAIIYDVYNKGQIGDEEFNYHARHVGGIVGRLSGAVEKAYNTGDIYNNDTVVGGIAGWWYSGTIKNAFNTGNITAITATELQVGGLVGAAGANATSLTNAYNLGTIRGYQQANDQEIYLGGIVGKAANLRIDNVYTLGNLYAGRGSNTYTKVDNGVGYIYGGDSTAKISKAYYITAEDSEFSSAAAHGASGINFVNRYDKEFYTDFGFNAEGYEGSNQNKGYVSADGVWRIYDGSTTPILNAFLPNTEKYFGNTTQNPDAMNNITSIQYGTAYDPLLTIINAKDNLIFDWDKLSIGGAGSLVVYGGGLTLDNVSTSNATGGSSYYGGVLYSDGALTIKGNENENLGFGSASELYGSEVTIKADGTVTIYGDVTATGNANDNNTTGNVTINAGDVNVYGTLTSATIGKDVSISGIASQANGQLNYTGVNNPKVTMPHIGDRFTYTTQNSTVDGNIIINAGTKFNDECETVTIGSGNVNLYYGNKQEGLITAGGNLDVTGTGNVYVDSDLDIGGNLTLTGNGENSEVVLDLTNIGQVQAKNELAENPNSNVTALDKFHDFMHDFGSQIGNDNRQIMLNAKISGDAKLTIDMWDKTQNNGQGGYNLNKYDQNTGHDLVTELNNLNINADIKTNNGTIGNVTSAKPITYIWVSDGDQLQAINNNGVNGLSYNYALKNDINASDVENYVAIGTGSEFTGTFDGRGNRIIGLDTTKNDNGTNTNFMANAGIFSTIGEGGTVKNVNIYSGNFTGTDTAGAVAGVNKGRIENVTGFGNTVEVIGAGIAGGIVGKNEGKGTFGIEDGASTLTGNGIYDVQSIGSVITASGVAGGLVGINDGALGNSYSDSAVTSTAGTSNGLGGVAGVNKGDVQFVDSLGVTNGGTNSDKVGGIIGVNNGNMYSGYNESIVSGKDNVGGIIGVNTSTVSNIVNATGVVGTNNIGGLVGDNSNSVTNGRNNGTITGNTNVGGLVGDNGKDAVLTDLVNAEAADIIGVTNVGGIAGSNAGTITTGKADDEDEKANLINRGSITGHTYVGGVAGTNSGIITNANNNVELNADTTGAQYFGGIAGENTGTIENATNTANVNAAGANYVGGIVGLNKGTLNGSSNKGSVTGLNFVGGVAGKNVAAIKGTLTNGELTTIKNGGIVTAESGGAGGIFGVNEGVIDSIHLVSEGIVKGTNPKTGESGTGGIFGINKGKITNSVLENTKGTVSGVSNTGGLIGINSGDISQTSLKNVADINIDNEDKVLNIGGLIGKNTGKIEGGRDAADSYYKYQIYNNGTITVTGEGENIGGLIGYNTIANGTPGSLTAGYNTGAIKAENSSNVGGIVGKNEGIVDQVFNTVMTGVDDKGNTVYGTITGKDNVGGLVGTNSGTLSNAYNTTAVNGAEGSTGNAVGVNDGNNAKVNFVYDVTNTNNTLIGKNTNNATISNSYTSADAEKGAVGTVGITYVSADKANDKDSYDKFAGDTWKFYDGNSNPLLKVFLTNLVIKDTNNKGQSLEEFLNLVYNGKEQDLNINVLIEKGFIEVPDEEALKAYYNTVIDKESGESHLLQNADGQVDAKGYSDWLYSNQIAANTDGKPFNPNNLGYDITYTTEGGTIDIGKLSINITLDDIYRIYGNVGNIFSDSTTENKTTYEDSYHVNTDGLDDSLVNYIMDNLKVTFEDKAIDGDKTQNVGSYDWSMNVIIGGDDASNYQINSTGLQETIIKGENKSHVEKADLTITLDDVERIYGNIGFVNNTGYGITNVNGLTNGDEDNKLNLSDNANITDAALINVAGEERTNDVKGSPYDWTVAGDASNFTGVDNLGTNYNITVVAGNSKVTPKTVTIKDLLATIVYGNQDNKGLQINTGASLADGSIVYGDDVTLVTDNANYITGGKYDENRGNRVTADAGTYTDSLYVNGLSLNGNKTENYVLDTTSAVGDITVTKADLSITINGVGTTYGTAFDESQYGYTLDKLVNGDGDNNSVINAIENAINNASGGYHNTGAADGTNGKVTQDAEGDYSLSFKNDITQKDVLTNYNITVVKDGDVNVSKKQIHIGANTEEIHLGERPDYTGTDINGELVNGDKLNGNYHYGVEDSADEKVVGDHSIGVWIGNTFYDLSATVDWTKVDGFFSNYEVIYKPGTLTVTEQVMPDLPDNWPNNRWDYLFGDNPFDRNENFRERKAEVNFVDGAMEI